MLQPTLQAHCSACKTTAAQWARANASHLLKLDLSSPGKPYPIPPTFSSESHPYARQIGETEIMTVPVPEAPQKKDWIRPEYDVVKKGIDMDYAKELIANIFPPGSKAEDKGPTPPGQNTPTPLVIPPRHLLSGPGVPTPRPYVPTPPYEGLSGSSIPFPGPYGPTPPYERRAGFNPEEVLQMPWPNVPLPPKPGVFDVEPEDAIPTPRPNVPLPPDAPRTQSLFGPYPRPNVPLPPDAPPNR